MTRPTLDILHVESGHEWRLTRDQVRLLVKGLREVPYVRQAVATLERSRLAVAAQELGVPVIPLPWAVGTDPRALRTLARRARRRWDVMHAHDAQALRLLTYLAALEGSPGSLVASRRSVDRPRSIWKWRRTSLVLAVSESARRVLVEHGVERGRVIIIPEGVDSAGLEPQRPGVLRDAAGARRDHFLIGSLAALGPDRDHATLIRAAELVTARHPGARFALFGEGPRRIFLERQIDRADLGGRVCLPGFVSGARSSIRDFDVLVMPSLREELSTGCLEAMSVGVPVVMMAAGDGRLRAEGVEPVPTGDHEALAETLGRFVEDDAFRREAGERARRQALVHDEEQMVRRTLRAYEAVARLDRAG